MHHTAFLWALVDTKKEQHGVIIELILSASDQFLTDVDDLSTSCFCQVALSNGRSVPAVLLANKCDQRQLGLCPKLPKLESFSREYGFVGWYETSAKARCVPRCLNVLITFFVTPHCCNLEAHFCRDKTNSSLKAWQTRSHCLKVPSGCTPVYSAPWRTPIALSLVLL